MKATKKKGSSLIMVLITFAVITIFGTAMLSLTASAYRKRIVESKEKRNQYFSESGLDIAYGVIGKIVDGAIDAGNNTVSDYMNTLNGPDGILQQEKERLKNGEIGDSSKISDKDSKELDKYINPDGTSKYIEDDKITVKEDYIKWQQNERFKNAYRTYVIETIKDEWLIDADNSTVRIIPMKDEDYTTTSQEITPNKPKVEIYNKEDESKQVEIAFKEFEKYEKTGKDESILPLHLKSNFIEDNIQKTIDVDYNILTPDYNQVYYAKSNKLEIPIMSVWKKAICIDGNLDIRGQFTVDGEVYAKGKDNGGVHIKADSYTVEFKDNLATAGDFQIIKPDETTSQIPNEADKKSVTLDKDVYTGNLEIGDGASNISLKVNGAAYANNDLALSGLKSNITITNGFYGINDITKKNDVIENMKPRVSSCIRVNADDIGQEKGSSINIGKELILMGTAYIKTFDTTKPFYQTGESVAVKGNYRAYNYPLPDSDEEAVEKGLNESNVIFEYINPLQLVTQYKDKSDGQIKELLIKQKSDYFTIYAQKYAEGQLKLNEGITLPESVSSIGSVFSKGVVSSESHFIDDDKKIQEKQRDYAKMAYEMGDSAGISDLDSVYAGGSPQKTVSNQINFQKLDFNFESKKELTNGNEVIYLNSNPNKKYALVAKNGNVPEGTTPIYLDDNGKGRGIIITNGDIELIGKIDFTGTIISAGSLKISDDESKNLKYDLGYVEKLIAYNYDKFKDIFNGFQQSVQNIEVDASVSKADNVGTDVIRDKLIIMEKWKIEK